MRIDLNADLGEGYGPWRIGEDAALLEVVTSASVACGFHAGDPEIMAATFAAAAARGVRLGAHPGFPDLWGFGRRMIPFSAPEIERLVAYQVGAAAGIAALGGQSLAYVKAHGALANLGAAEPEVARAIARAVRAVDPGLGLMAIATTALVREGAAAGLRVIHEVYADRAFAPGGGLVPRGAPGAMIAPQAALGHVRAMLAAGAVIAADGTPLASPLESVCVHGDGPGAAALARALRAGLEAAGVTVAA